MKRKEKTDILSNNDQANDLAAQLLNNQDSLDFGSLMNMANHLLKDDSLMEMVEELAKSNNQTIPAKATVLNTNTDLSILQTQINELRRELALTKQDVTELKKQNSSILNMGMQAAHTTSRNLLKGFSILSGIRSFLK